MSQNRNARDMSALDVSEIFRSYGKLDVLLGVSFSIQESSLWGLVGPSGGGKSVLLKIIAGVLEADQGTVDVHNLQNDEVSLMFQEGALFDSLTVFDNIAFPLVHGAVPTGTLEMSKRIEVRDRVEEILTRVGLEKHAYKFPAQLSGGMRRRVSLARTLVARPKLALLDDPTCGLDPVASSVIMNLVVELHAEYRPSMIIVSHDLRRLLPVVDGILCLFDGKIAFQGKVRELPQEQKDVIEFISCRYDLEQEGLQDHV